MYCYEHDTKLIVVVMMLNNFRFPSLSPFVLFGQVVDADEVLDLIKVNGIRCTKRKLVENLDEMVTKMCCSFLFTLYSFANAKLLSVISFFCNHCIIGSRLDHKCVETDNVGKRNTLNT
jgi:hypothetical protein